MTEQTSISFERRILEIGAVVLTGLGKFVFMDWLNWRLLYIVAACLFWIAYIGYQYRKDATVLSYWGLHWNGFKRTFMELLLPAALLVLGFVMVGNELETNILDWSIVPVLWIYPIWGVIQQFVMIGIIARNMKDMKQVQLPDWLIACITALVFGIVHYPYFLLIVATFFLALVYTMLYLKGRNLLAMGVYHGWLGAFLFYTILQRNSWQEVFGNFFQ